ncbi:MAG: hypothetical protein IPO92_14345 [Saprospiraceae bacterium]|nr:hypothetical protein [Saprospiraceae bacterium]
MHNNLAVVDLGSNTFHLLIVSKDTNGSLKTIYRARVFVGLSDGGIEVIKEDKIKLGLETIRLFKAKLDFFGNTLLKVAGTAVLRKASNRMEFIHKAEEILQTRIEILDGQTEAEYIYKGIMLLPKLLFGTYLIMDIGGGSTEFIIVVDGIKVWWQSYTLGVGVLHHLFHNKEPIGLRAIHSMTEYVKNMITEMLHILEKYKIEAIIGASGSFEVLQSMTSKIIKEDEISIIQISEFEALYQNIINTDFEKRQNLPGLPKERTKLIVVGMALKKIIIDIAHPSYIIVSPYAMKEGILSEMLL